MLEFDLLEVGDDVVFGSRSVVKCATGTAMKPVKLKTRCNIADRCYISPGVTVGMIKGINTIETYQIVLQEKGQYWDPARWQQKTHTFHQNQYGLVLELARQIAWIKVIIILCHYGYHNR